MASIRGVNILFVVPVYRGKFVVLTEPMYCFVVLTEPSYRGKGLGKEVTLMMMRYGKQTATVLGLSQPYKIVTCVHMVYIAED